MIQVIKQSEITDLSDIIAECPVLPILFVERFLQARGKTDEQIEIIVNQMIRKKLMYRDASNSYFLGSKTMRTSDLSSGKVKALWLTLELSDSIQRYFIQHDLPHVLTFVNRYTEGDDPFFDVFYVQYGDENLASFSIESKYKGDQPRKIFVILDDPSQIAKLKISEKNFIIYKYVLVTPDGCVTFLDKGV